METRKIGTLKVSVVGLGTNNFGWRLDAEGAEAVVRAALEAGITLFDTADVYGGTRSEEYLGRALGGRRREAIIATKFGSEIDEHRRGAWPEYVRQAVEASLLRLGTDYIDVYQLHRPDPHVPIEDTLGALGELVCAGKVREIGSSNFSVEHIREAEEVAAGKGLGRFASVQNEYSLFERAAERDVIPECERLGLAFIPFFPLASGLLTGKYRLGQPPPVGSRLATRGAEALSGHRLQQVEALIAFAEARGHTLLELAVSWLLAKSVIASVIAGATTPDQVRANRGAAGWRLTPEELAEMDRIAPA